VAEMRFARTLVTPPEPSTTPGPRLAGLRATSRTTPGLRVAGPASGGGSAPSEGVLTEWAGERHGFLREPAPGRDAVQRRRPRRAPRDEVRCRGGVRAVKVGKERALAGRRRYKEGMNRCRFFPETSLAAFIAVLALHVPEAAADFTLHASAGASYNLSGLDADRGPVTFDLAPGLDFERLRIELPFVFGAETGAGLYPPAPHAFLGVRPQAKLFLLGGLYGKAAVQLFYPDFDKKDLYLGASLGGGLEFKVAGLAINGELNLNPFFTPSAVLPVDLRLGVTLFF
jgi:hypothetical protein